MTFKPNGILLGLLIVVCVDALYAFPYVWNWAEIGSSQVPPFVSDDIYFYLNVSHAAGASVAVNPWFGNAIPANEVPYLRFFAGPVLFHSIESLLPGRDTVILFGWNMFWTSAIVLAAMWAASCLSLRPLSAVWLASVSLISLVALPSLVMGLYRWFRSGVFSILFLQLPFYRSFYPQIAVPLVLVFVGLQIKAFRESKSRRWWLLLAATEIAAFIAFPYAALLMLCSSVLAIALQRALFSRAVDWPGAAIYLGSAAVCNFIFLVCTGSPSQLVGVNRGLPIAFDPRLPERGSILVSGVVLAATAATYLLELRSGEERDATSISLGLALVALTWLSDVLSGNRLMLSLHVAYFSHVVLAILLVRCFSLLEKRLDSTLLQRAAVALAIACIFHGGIASGVSATSRPQLEVSRSQGALIRLLQQQHLGPNDLALTASFSPTQESLWIPILSGSQVLFEPYGQLFVPLQDENLYWFRLALYLHLTGKDATSVERGLTREDDIASLLGPRRIPELSGTNRLATIRNGKQALIGEMRKIESNPRTLCDFFRRFNRIVIVEESAKPTFDPGRLYPCLPVHSAQSLGHWKITIATVESE